MLNHSHTPSNTDPVYWFELHNTGSGDDAPHGEALAALRRTRDRQGYRRAADRLYLRMYDDVRYVGFGRGEGGDTPESVLKSRLRENIIRAIVKTAHSKVGRQRLRPKPVTEGGNFALQEQAELMDKWLNGMFDDLKADHLFAIQRLHGMIVGTGAIYVGHDGTQLIAEISPTWELSVDASEARYGTPPTLYRTRSIDRFKLIAKFPEYKEQILSLSQDKRTDGVSVLEDWDDDSVGDMVQYHEAWRLPTSEDSEDGRYICFADGVTFINDLYTRDHFPFSFFKWAERPFGFWGAGLVEDLVGQQIEYDITLQNRQKAMHLLSAPYVLIEKGSKIVKSHFNNQIGRLLEFVGVEPKVVAPNPIAPDVFQHGDRVKESMFELARISQMSVSGEKPAGLDSGKALRTYADLEAEGLIEPLRQAEASVVSFAELLIEAAVELEESRDEAAKDEDSRGKLPKLSTDFRGDDGIERIDWRDFDLQRDKFRLKIAPVSALSTTVAGKFQDLQDLRDLGIVTEPAEMRQLLGMPDLEQSANRQLAHRKLLLKVLEIEILKKGIYWEPEPTWDMDLALELAVDTLLDATLRGAPEPKLELLRKFIVAVQTNLGVVDPPAPDPATGLPGDVDPMAAPGGPMPGMPPMDPAMMAGGPVPGPPMPGMDPAQAAPMPGPGGAMPLPPPV